VANVTPALRRNLQGYYAHISAVDAEFGRLLGKLEETGQAEDTIVVYTSDHGDMMGSHGYSEKNVPWEESCRVPMLVRYPRLIAPGATIEGLFSTIDIYPTICGLSGLKAPAQCVGRDLSPAIRGEALKFPESSFLMLIRRENNVRPFRGVRTDRYTYAVAEDGRWLLYDNREDPFQMRNLIDDRKAARLHRELNGMVRDWLKFAGDPFPIEKLRRGRSALADVRG
jgi:arylsulfatase A-like enzyme